MRIDCFTHLRIYVETENPLNEVAIKYAETPFH